MLKRVRILNMYVPSDKSVSLEILRVMKENPNGLNYNDLLQNLPHWCRSRIRSVRELRGFFGLYKEFHHDCRIFAKKCSSPETKLEQESEDIGNTNFEEENFENFRMMSPIDVIGDDEGVLEI